MPFQTIFNAANLIALISWGLLIAIPEARLTRWLVRSFAAPLVLCGLYLIPAIPLATADTFRAFASFDGVRHFFSEPVGILAGWCHYLAIDLAVGVWMVGDAIDRGLSNWWRAPILLLIYMAGPAGILVYFAVRSLLDRRNSSGLLQAKRVST